MNYTAEISSKPYDQYYVTELKHVCSYLLQGDPGIAGGRGVQGERGRIGDPGTIGPAGPTGQKGEPGSPAQLGSANFLVNFLIPAEQTITILIDDYNLRHSTFFLAQFSFPLWKMVQLQMSASDKAVQGRLLFFQLSASHSASRHHRRSEKEREGEEKTEICGRAQSSAEQ